MPTHDIIVIGGSSGAIEPLIQLVRELPPDIPAALFVTIHVSPKSEKHPAEDPQDALFPDMPRNALSTVRVDYCLPAAQIAPFLLNLAQEAANVSATKEEGFSAELKGEIGYEELDMAAIENDHRKGQLSGFACPDGGGTLWEIDEMDFLRFRCRVGHGHTAETLSAQQSESIDGALWSARALEENASLARRIAERARKNKHLSIADKFKSKATQAEEQARLIRSLIANQEALAGTKDQNPEFKPKSSYLSTGRKNVGIDRPTLDPDFVRPVERKRHRERRADGGAS